MAVRELHMPSDLRAAHSVVVQLRPHLDADAFVAAADRQRAEGYRAVVEAEGRIVAYTGFRLLTTLAWGKVLYVDDLVTDADVRLAGHGKELLDWLKAEAARLGCDELHLDSGHQRKDAHRFYHREGLADVALHFARPVVKLPP